MDRATFAGVEMGDYEHARVKFAAARGLVKSDDILWNLALAEAKSGHTAEAVNHFREYERDPKARAGDVKEAEGKWLPELVPQVGQVAIDGGAGTGVKVDGADLGPLPLPSPWAVMPGAHHVEGKTQAGELTTRDVAVVAAQTVSVHLGAGDVAPVAPVVVAPPIAPEPNAPASLTPDAGEHHGLTTGRKVAIGLGGAAVAVEAMGVVFGVVAKNKDNDAIAARNGRPSWDCQGDSSASCSSLHDAGSAARSDATIADVMYIGGGVVAAVAIVTWLVSSPREEKTGVRVDPAVGPGFAGLRVGGSF